MHFYGTDEAEETYFGTATNVDRVKWEVSSIGGSQVSTDYIANVCEVPKLISGSVYFEHLLAKSGRDDFVGSHVRSLPRAID